MFIRNIFFVSHERSSSTGASIALYELMRKCRVESRMLNLPLYRSRLLRLVYFTKHCVRSKRSVYILNTINNIDLAFIAMLLGKDFLIILHETEKFIGDGKIKHMILNFLGGRVVLVDRRLKEKYKKAKYVGNLVPLGGFDNGKYSFDPNKLRYGIIGTIDKNKRQLLAVDMYRRLSLLSPSALAIIGGSSDSVYKNSVEMECKDLEVEFCGELPREVVHLKYDILLATSEYESYGLAVAEAAYRGKPVIFFDRNSYPNLHLDLDNVFDFNSITSDEIQRIRLLCELLNRSGYRPVESPDFSYLNKIMYENFDITNPFQ
jgi:hypothetical protein